MPPSSPEYQAIVIGGGLFGCYIALLLKRAGFTTLLIEQEASLLQRASYRNQARVHGGYHYPRSLMTALRSSQNYAPFMAEFGECVQSEFQQIYAIARKHSKVSASQFFNAMKRVNAPLSPAPPKIQALFASSMVEEVFIVREPVFNAALLKEMLQQRLLEAGVEIRLQTKGEKVCPLPDGSLSLQVRNEADQEEALTTKRLFNCTYSRVNHLHAASGLPLIPLQYEWTEMALVQPPPKLEQTGITLMCGPFFSFMPFPDRGLHTLSHVRYTPHLRWNDAPDRPFQSPPFDALPRVSRFPLMLKDAARFVPALADAVYCDSLWEIKTLLPVNETDDGRPILFTESPHQNGLYTVVGGKIDNVFDLSEVLRNIVPTA